MDPVKPTLYLRDAVLLLSFAGLLLNLFADVGSSFGSGEATHLPIRAGYNRVHTAKAGIFLSFFKKFIVDFRNFLILLETCANLGYNDL